MENSDIYSEIDHLDHRIDDYLNDSELARTLLKGTPGMQAAGPKYLPVGSEEDSADYSARLKRSVLKNVYRKTCSFLTGQVFQKSIVWDPDLDPRITSIFSDIDGLGNSDSTFFSRIFFDAISSGSSSVLVDSPARSHRPRGEHPSDSPYLNHVKTEQIRGFRSSESRRLLTQLRIAGTISRPVGDFGHADIPTVLLYESDFWRVFWKTNGEYYPAVLDGEVLEGENELGYIPLSTFIPGDQTSFVTGIPPMDDLSYLQLQHWQSNSDQTHILHIARVPILFGRYIKQTDVNVDVSTIVNTDEEGSVLKWVEVNGGSIPHGRDAIKDIEASMGLYGLQLLIPRQGNMTATEKRLSSSESNSTLGSWVVSFENFLQSVVEDIGAFLGIPVPDRCASVNKEFDYRVTDSQHLLALLTAVSRNVLSPQSCLREFIRLGAVSEKETVENIQSEIEENAAVS